jgi:phosphoribosylglycinamide formyltransferase-1
VKIGVLASGGGTNLQALLDAQVRGELDPGRIVAVGVNVPGCGAVGRAEAAGVPHFCVDHKSYPDRIEFDRTVARELRVRGVELVVLAGFMRLLGEDFLAQFPRGVMNIHPALLPAFPGVHAQHQALAYGVKIAGCTVHFVDAGMDTGPIIAQAAVPVLDDDDDDRIRARILAEEHRLYPTAVRAVAQGRVRMKGRRVLVDDAPRPDVRLRSL